MSVELSEKKQPAHDPQKQGAATQQDRPFVFAPSCAREPEGRGCFLHPDDRAALVSDFKGRVRKAGENVSMAITVVGFEKLIEKDEELSWLVELVLGVVSFGVASALTRVAKGAVSAAIEKLHELGAVGRLTGEPSFAAWAEGKVRSINDTTIKSLVTSLVTKSKDGLLSFDKKETGSRTDHPKAQSLSYLETLREESDEAFQRVAETTPRRAGDAELLELLAAFDVTAHTVARYAQMFRDKLKRFHSSGVTSIGRKDTVRDSGYALAKQGIFKYAQDAVVRDTRVVWHTFVSGYPPQLMYEFQDGEPGLDFQEAIRLAQNQRPVFGPRAPRTAKPELGGAVPDEFVNVALERHRAMWGSEPATVLIDDSHSYDPMRVASAMRNKAKQRPQNAGGQ